ncbi:MAG: nucleotidyl transferase AbiEii/AbiGii toxin family protein [Spirochaetia bacterium]|nr:nucleotidyl transferase AbiEii/AbiGii toxin family protein [Spirochaetia bacterium]MCF7953498.1 nucleotidyl transferase AbiEii/AbiGii toxin family protein [Spirochaetales bacterium]
MDRQNPYFKQVELLVRILPLVGSVKCFALKGGTAINLFYRDMPRLSVDIDLVYIPIKDRDSSLAEISEGLLEIGRSIEKLVPNVNIRYSQMGKTDYIIKLFIQVDRSIVKVELSPVLRGTVRNREDMRIRRAAEETFGFAEVPVVSFDDLFAGKIVAALDRQHPRDLFDIKLLLENEGITLALKEAFLVYLISHNRRILEVLNPTILDIQQLFDTDFKGMTVEPVTVSKLEKARLELINIINQSLTEADKRFLIQFKKGNPNWDHINIPHIKNLPAVKWKLYNQDRMKRSERYTIINRLSEFFQI